MALIPCPECEKKISDATNSCSNCGYQLTPEKVAEIKKKEQKVQKGRLIGCLSVIVIFFILIIIGIIIGQDQKNKQRREERNEILKSGLKSYVESLNDPRLGNPGFTLENSYWIVLLNENGAIWELEVSETDPRNCNIVGLVPGWFWRQMWIDKKENLMKGIIVRVHEITKDKNSFAVTIKDRSSGKVLAKRDFWGLKIYE